MEVKSEKTVTVKTVKFGKIQEIISSSRSGSVHSIPSGVDVFWLFVEFIVLMWSVRPRVRVLRR